MELNLLLRGQSNSVYFDQLGGSEAVRNALEHELGFDGVENKVNLIGASSPDADGDLTMLGATAFLPAVGVPTASTWLESPGPGSDGPFSPGAVETKLLGHVGSLPADEKDAPTLVLWMHSESDGSWSGQTAESWEAGVRYDAGLVRAALDGQGAATVPYLFVAIPFDPDVPASIQAIKQGMEKLAADPSFDASIATRTGDLDMDNPANGLPEGRVVYGGPHVDQTDVDILAGRISASAVDVFARYALPGSPVALAGGHLDDSGPQAVSATAVHDGTVIVELALDPDAGGLGKEGAEAAAGLGWTAQDGDVSDVATASFVRADDSLVLVFATPPAAGSTLFYGYGGGRIAIGADTHHGAGYPGEGPGDPGGGNSLYDGNGLPVWASASGVAIGGEDVPGGVLPGTAIPGGGYFDASWYLAHNPDVAAAGVDPLLHYEEYGWKEGRDPGPSFSTDGYLAANPDVRAAGVDPLLHYLEFGQTEGRVTFPADPLVDPSYLGSQGGGTSAAHPVPTASAAAESYASTGWMLGLDPDPLFDTNWYLAHNPDVRGAGVDPLLHYEEYGWHEGRDPGPSFSTDGYLASHPDVRASGIDPLLAYVESGMPGHA